MWSISKLKQSVQIGSYSIAKAWILKKELEPNGLGKDYNTLMCHLDCVQCQCGSTYALENGTAAYMHCLQNTKDWYSTQFIAGFMAMIQHDAHMLVPPFKTEDWIMMVLTHYPNKPILEVTALFGRVDRACSKELRSWV